MSMAIRKERVVPRKDTLWHQVRINKASYLLMAPYFILFFLFTVLPVLMSVYLSFNYFNMLEAPRWVGWANYIKLLLEDDIFIISLRNTLLFAVITGPVSYLLCLLFAWIINEFKPRVRAFLTLVFYAPSICGNAYMIWNLILTGDRYGYLNGILLRMGFLNEPILWMQTEKCVMPVLIVVQLWLSLGTGNPSVNYSGATIVTHLLDYGSTRLDMGYASAIATILFLLMVGTNKLVQRILRRVGE